MHELRTRIGRMPLLCGFLLILVLAVVPADVVFLKDGTIVLASYKSTSGDTMTYTVGEREISFSSGEILRSESTMASLTGKKIEIELVDKTVIEGTFTDYDTDIGYFIDLSFGTLTIPADRVVRMIDPVQSRRYQGSAVAIGLRGSYLVAVGSDNFKSMYGGGASAEFGLPFFRGLFGGVGLDVAKLETDGLDDLSYLLVQITPNLTYRYLEFRTGQGALSRLVPFASLGGGMTVIYVRDIRDGVYPDSYGAFSPHIRAEIGTDLYITDSAYLRLGGAWTTVFQEGDAFSAAGASLACYFEL